jgi:hypothetical protein
MMFPFRLMIERFFATFAGDGGCFASTFVG